MTTYTTYADGEAVVAKSGGTYHGTPARAALVGIFDSSRRGLVAADVVEVIKVPAGTYVEAVFMEILTAEATAAQTINVGDGSNTSGYIAAANSSAAAGTKVLGAGAFATGKFYTTADTIDITVPALMVATTLKVKITALVSIV